MRIKMLDRRHIGVLRGSRARDGNQRLAGSVRDQMKMKVAGVWHLYSSRMRCGQDGEEPASKTAM